MGPLARKVPLPNALDAAVASDVKVSMRVTKLAEIEFMVSINNLGTNNL
jgi:hypothetical protein